MAERSLKTRLTAYAGDFAVALLLLQPLLDVLSYFMQGAGATAFTTALRMTMLVGVSIYGFAISDKKQAYGLCYMIIGGFWVLHMLNCWRVGYARPVEDAAEYLKLVQLPLWILSFVTLFRKCEGLNYRVLSALVANLAIILLVVGLSFLIGPRVYTYDYPERSVQIGVLGWFALPNTQSAILCLLAPAVLLWGLRTERVWLFGLCGAASLGLLYFTGTRLTYYAAVLLAVAFLVLIVLCRKPYVFCLPLFILLLLLLVFRGASPMERRQDVRETSYEVYQEKIDKILGEDQDFSYREGEEIPPEILEKIETVYREIYGVRGVYKEVLLEDLLERFGLERVMEEFDYTTDAEVLNHTRIRKLKVMNMIWEEQDFLTRLLGMEHEQSRLGESFYDPENDFPSLVYYLGYLGAALYLCFLLGILFYGALAFVRRFPSLLTVEFATTVIMFVLALGIAQITGHVLRRPNVTVYASLSGAMLYIQARDAPSKTRLRLGHQRNPSVYLKKVK